MVHASTLFVYVGWKIYVCSPVKENGIFSRPRMLPRVVATQVVLWGHLIRLTRTKVRQLLHRLLAAAQTKHQIALRR